MWNRETYYVIWGEYVMAFTDLNDKQIMGLCIYGEARGETTEGKIAVGSVILERVKKGGWFGRSISGVILKPYQFSCFLPNDPNYPKLLKISDDYDKAMADDHALNDCYGIADGLIEGRIQPNVVATHYKTLSCHASWGNSMKKVTTINHHEFYM
jgi:spore germination cell wall hydrolase CwlJ-like protein